MNETESVRLFRDEEDQETLELLRGLQQKQVTIVTESAEYTGILSSLGNYWICVTDNVSVKLHYIRIEWIEAISC